METNKRYSCGMYGGSFDPLHMGHVKCMLAAANACEKLIIVISSSPERDSVDIRERYRWVYRTISHFPHVKLYVLTDDAPTKAEYTRENWLKDAEKIKAFAGEPITAVFFGSDYGKDGGIYAECYPDAEMVVLERDGISSTAIRQKPLTNRYMMPSYVRCHYNKKVLVAGTESTGKSTLVQSLARRYDTCFLEEVGRDISARSGTDMWMLPIDFTDILLTHKEKENRLMEQADRVLFEDTDALTTLFYINFLDGNEKEPNIRLAEAIAGLNTYDLVLLLNDDVPFVQDGDRSETIAADRQRYTRLLKELYESHGCRTVVLSGSYSERFDAAVRAVDGILEGL